VSLWIRWLARAPRTWLLAFLALTAGVALQLWDFTAGAPRLRVETTIERLIPEHDEERRFFDGFRERFGSDEFVLVVLVADDVLSAENLERLRRVTERVGALDGIQRVVSLTNAIDVRAAPDGVRVEPFLEAKSQDAAALRARVLANPVVAGSLVAYDGGAAAVLVQPEPMSELEFRRLGLDRTIERIAREEADGAEIVVGGAPPLKATTSRLVLRDAIVSTACGIAITGLVGVFAFRSVWGALLPLLCVVSGQLFALGGLAFTGRPLSLVTAVIPPVVNAVGIAYGMHLVAELEEMRRQGLTGAAATWAALERVAAPVLLCALTTVAGFLSLCTSSLAAIREFGLFCALGTTACMAAALWALPCWLAIAPPGFRRRSRRSRESKLPELAARVARFDLRHRGAILAASAGLVALSLFGMTRIEVSTSLIHNLAADHPLRLAYARIDERLDGSSLLHVMLEGEGEGAFHRPEQLRRVEELQRWLAEQPEVGHTLSIADWVGLIHRAVNGDDPSAQRIPDSERLVDQLFYFFWDEQLERLVDDDFSAVSIQVRVHSTTSAGFAALIERIEARLAELPPGLDGRITGSTVLIVRAVDDIARSQALSLATGLFSIGGLLVLYFRSVRVGLLALIPNALPVVAYFGALGLFGVTLNPTTALVACLVLGVAVDDTLHNLARFQRYVRKGLPPDEAAVEALRSVARPIALTALVLCGALLSLGTSELRHQVEFGVLGSGTLLLAAILDATLTPVLASRLMPKPGPGAPP
jgi:predicted RND superfamily exporter protein